MADSKKLGSTARRLLQEPGGATTEVGVLVRGSAAFTPPQLEELRQMGAHVRTVAGDVLTADVPVKQLNALAGCDFVIQVEVSQPLYPDRRSTSGFRDAE